MLKRKFEVSSDDVLFCTVSPRHIYGLLFGLLLPLVAGARFVNKTTLSVEAAAQAAEDTQATILVSVPAHLIALSSLDLLGKNERLRQIVSSAARLPIRVGKNLVAKTSAQLTEILGSTETGGIFWRNVPEETWASLPGVQARSSDEGQLIVVSPYLADATREHVTDDLVKQVGENQFKHLGRSDLVIKIGGKRIQLDALEQQICSLQDIRAARLISKAVTSIRGHELWLVVETDRWTLDDLIKELRKTLDPMAIPRRVRIVSKLPTESNGKLSQAKLSALFEAESSAVEFRELIAYDNDYQIAVHVTASSKRFRGHFPGLPILPAVSVLVDIVLSQTHRIWPELDRLVRVPRLKFTRGITPGQELLLHLKRKGSDVTFKISSDDIIYSKGILEFLISSKGAVQ